MKDKLLIIALALALVIVTFQWVSLKKMQSSSNSSQGVYENIMTRTSVRSYQDKSVSKDVINKLLHAGMAAPSAVNKQPWHFIVVTNKNELKAIAEATPNASMAKDAPLAIVVCGVLSKALQGEGQQIWVQDCSAASENILLAAHGLRLGAVWTGTYPSKERCAAISYAFRSKCGQFLALRVKRKLFTILHFGGAWPLIFKPKMSENVPK